MIWPTLSPAEWSGAAAMATYAGLLAWRARAAFAYVRAEDEAFGNRDVSGWLTILQPIVSGGPALERCLRASAALAGPRTRLHWLLDEGDEEAQRITREVDRPGITIQSLPPAPLGMNPKVHKLMGALDGVDTEFIAVLDDDTAISTRHVNRAIHALRSDHGRGGIYTGLPTCRAVPESTGGTLLAAFVNSTSALTYLPPAHAGRSVSLGGTFYVTRIGDLRAVGGFDAIADQPLDGLALAHLYRRANRQIHQGAVAQLLYTGPLGTRAYFQRMRRWFVLLLMLRRGAEAPPSTRLRLVWTLGVPPILLWMSLFGAVASRPLAIAFAVLLMVRFWTLSALMAATQDAKEVNNGSGAEIFPISSTLSEFLQPVHFLHACLTPKIH